MFTGRINAKLQYFGHLMLRANSYWKRLMAKEKGGSRGCWLDNSTDSMDMDLSKLWEIVGARGAWQAIVHGVSKGQIGLSN